MNSVLIGNHSKTLSFSVSGPARLSWVQLKDAKLAVELLMRDSYQTVRTEGIVFLLCGCLPVPLFSV
jgi:hypothetical protein